MAWVPVFFDSLENPFKKHGVMYYAKKRPKDQKDAFMRDQQDDLIREYFDYLAKSFPVMCSSDEFHFLPRAVAAGRYYQRLDDLAEEAITEYLSVLEGFQKAFAARAAEETDLERHADFELLKANIAGILIELDTKGAWRHNPLLYLKIAFIGLDHALNKPAHDQEERSQRTLARLSALPRLFQQGMDNICSVPATYHQAALQMVQDGKAYLKETVERFPYLDEEKERAFSALDGFGRFLVSLPPRAERAVAASSLEETLKRHFLSERTLPEVFEIAVEEWRENQEALERLQRTIDPSSSWKELYHAYSPSRVEALETKELYEEEMARLVLFFRNHGFEGWDIEAALTICETPTYLRSVRSPASFSAALLADPGEKDLFYMTTGLPADGGTEAAVSLKRRLHREYKFLCAHETVPGHHLLDQIRRGLENPVRRQIESALFYEGWAYYAEALLTECGYVDTPIESLVDCKRRLWRAARCQIDVGLSTGRLTREEALRLVTSAGFSAKEAESQIERFQLNPGYQLCYTLGRYEIMKLRAVYGPRMGLDLFHKNLLEGGQLPFHLIEKRFQHTERTKGND
jgi:hypothetical protein